MSETTPLPPRLKELLSAMGRRLGLDHPGEVGAVWSRWDEIVGAEIARHARPSSLRSGILRVRTESPVWATEISYLGDEIRQRANAISGRELVTDVRVWTGPGPLLPEPDSTRPRPPDRTERAVPDDPLEAFDRARRAWLRRRMS